MKDSQITENEDSQLVRDLMDPAVQIESDVTVDNALQRLDQQNVHFGVVSSASGEPFGIVTRKRLIATNPEEQLRTLSLNIPHPETVRPTDHLDSVVLKLAEDFIQNQEIPGIVVQEQSNIQGFLPRVSIIKHAWNIKPRMFDLFLGSVSAASGAFEGYPVDRLAGGTLHNVPPYKCLDCPGAPQCPNGPEERNVEYYDRKDPPTCTQGKRMKQK